jgi:hypothetical protein
VPLNVASTPALIAGREALIFGGGCLLELLRPVRHLRDAPRIIREQDIRPGRESNRVVPLVACLEDLFGVARSTVYRAVERNEPPVML